MKKIFSALLLLSFAAILFAAKNEAKYNECFSVCRSEMRKCRDQGNNPRGCLDTRNDCVKKCREMHMDGEGLFKK